MGVGIENLPLLQKAEAIADSIWERVGKWNRFDRETIGSQLVRAADSIGANIAEGHGRYHYGEKLNFLYFARGSLFETQYWLRRCGQRPNLDLEDAETLAAELDDLAKDLNGYINYLRSKRSRS